MNCLSETKIYEQRPSDFSPKVEVAATYVKFGDKLLFLELSHNKSEAGAWGVPAGKLESNEEPIKAAKRELFEETGINVPSESLFQSFGQLYVRKPDIDYIYHLFGVNLKTLPDIHLSNEHLSHKWVLRQEAEQLPLMQGAKGALDFYYQRASEQEWT